MNFNKNSIIVVAVSFVAVIAVFFGVLIATGKISKKDDDNKASISAVETSEKSEKGSKKSGLTPDSDKANSGSANNGVKFTLPPKEKEEISEINNEVSNALGKIKVVPLKPNSQKGNNAATASNIRTTKVAATKPTKPNTTKPTKPNTTTTTAAAAQHLTESIVKSTLDSNKYTVECYAYESGETYYMIYVKDNNRIGYEMYYGEECFRILLMNGYAYIVFPDYGVYYIESYVDEYELDLSEYFYPYDNEFMYSDKDGSLVTESYYSNDYNCETYYTFNNKSLTNIEVTEYDYGETTTFNFESFKKGVDAGFFSLSGYQQISPEDF